MVRQRLFAVLFATVAAMIAVQDAGRAAPNPRFEVAPCPFPADDSILKQVRCGYLEVLENRAKPDGRRLKLAVAILKSLSPTSRPDPVVVLSGGPGEPFVGRVPTLITNKSMDVLRADRDIIVYDQRGVSFSEPKFCPELADAWAGPFDTPTDRRTHQRDVAARCGESMRRAGYDLSQYNSVVSAHDLQDLRRALNVKSWNLHGRSYGSRLALVAMRVSPEGIRSVAIDGPSPPNRSKWFNLPGDYSDVLKRLSAACAAQPDCHAAFPAVEQTFWRTLDALGREPYRRQRTLRDRSSRPVTVTPARFAGAVYGALERLQPGVPMLIYAMHARDDNRLVAVNRALAQIRETRLPGSPGFTHTVDCFESAPLATPELLQQMRKEYPRVLTDEDVFGGPEGCDAMHPYRARPEQLAAVTSDIPTLIITGEFDLQTHRSNGPLVAKTLKNSQLVDVPGVAHIPSFKYECTRTMMREFHNNPMQKVDVSCLKSIPPVRFVTDVAALAK
jgi:pimeloyl-ACP methyl ester carboxylesterase